MAQDNSVSAKVDNAITLPLLHVSAGYQFSPRTLLSVGFNGISMSDDSERDSNLVFRYKLNRYWDVGLGIGFYERGINNSELRNEVEYNSGHVAVGYTFY